MTKLKKIKITFFIIISCINLFSQDFNQIFQIPQYYNAAFTGVDKCSKIILSNKYHPISFEQNFFINNLLVDLSIKKISGGLKINIHRENTPNKIFSKNSFSFGYAYNNNLTRKIRFSLATQINYLNESINSQNLVFPNMLSLYSNEISLENEIINKEKKNSINFGFGGLLYSKTTFFSFFVDNFWNIELKNRTTKPFVIRLLAEKQLVRRDYFGKINLNTAFFISKYFQNSFIGLNYVHEKISGGIFINQNLYNSRLTNSISPQVAFSFGSFNIGYSYNFYLGKLYRMKSSSHEITLKLNFSCSEKSTNNTINCPAYKL